MRKEISVHVSRLIQITSIGNASWALLIYISQNEIPLSSLAFLSKIKYSSFHILGTKTNCHQLENFKRIEKNYSAR